METQKSDTFTIRKDTLWKYSTFVLIGVVILLVVMLVLPGKSPTGNVIQEPGQQLPSEAQRIEVNIDGAPVKGNKNAPVTMVEFTDYECPFCKRHNDQTGPVINDLIEAGTVKLVTMDYPLPFHPQAQKAAEAAHCARDQEGDAGYYEMHDLLFGSGVAGGEVAFKEYARQMGLKESEFTSCLSSGKFAEVVQNNLAYGASIGIQGTPGFFINGYLVSGACPATTFTQAIALAEDGKKVNVVNCVVA